VNQRNQKITLNSVQGTRTRTRMIKLFITPNYELEILDTPVPDRFETIKPEGTQPINGCLVSTSSRERSLIHLIKRTAKVVKKVVETDDVLFGAGGSERVPTFQPLKTRHYGLAKSLFTCMDLLENGDLDVYFPGHVFNPYVELLLNAMRARPLVNTVHHCLWKPPEVVRQLVVDMNGFVNDMRNEAGSPGWRKRFDSLRRRCDKNHQMLRHYLDEVFLRRGSRHLVIRLDLSYAMEHANRMSRPTTITLQQAKRDLQKFQRYLREKQPLTAFSAKREYGLRTGYHFHCLIFLDGHLVQKDLVIGRLLGEYWQDVITEGQGRYLNCNGLKHQFRGVGMINYYDTELRANLTDKVCPYLTKTDFWLEHEGAGCSFTKGHMPEPPAKSGRARKL
jgi:hypothetical protein